MSLPAVLLFVLALGCSPGRESAPPSPNAAPRSATPPAARCADAVEHAAALLAADPGLASAAADLTAHRAERVAECERVATPDDLACVLRARTAAELGTCPPPGAHGGAR